MKMSKTRDMPTQASLTVYKVFVLCHRYCMMENAQYVLKKSTFFSFFRETEQIK